MEYTAREGRLGISLPKLPLIFTGASSIICFAEGGPDALTLRLLCCPADYSPYNYRIGISKFSLNLLGKCG
jgi:hypothetical protein